MRSFDTPLQGRPPAGQTATLPAEAGSERDTGTTARRPFHRLRSWFPAQSDLSGRMILTACLAALTAVGLAGLTTHRFLPGIAGPFLLASMGASAVLLFVVPSSPMSRPWPFVGGHLISALVGITCAQTIADPSVAAALAVAGAILAMHLLRCLHPPGGAAALLTVVGGEGVHQLGYQFIVTPLAINLAVMLGSALFYWRWVLPWLHGRGEPQAIETVIRRGEDRWPAGDTLFAETDLQRAMHDMDTFLDIGRRDLMAIYRRAQAYAHARQLGPLRCGELMSTPPIAVEFASELEEAWALLARHGIRGLPVIDRGRHVIGIITVSDFLRHAEDMPGATLAERLALLRRPSRRLESDKPEVVGQIMTRSVITVCAAQSVAEVMPLFSEHRIHHLPVVDGEQRLVGILTRADLAAVCDGTRGG